MRHLNFKHIAIPLGLLVASIDVQAFEQKNIHTTFSCNTVGNCIFNLDVPDSDPITSFHVQVKTDPTALTLMSVTPASWTPGNNAGSVFFQGDSYYGDLKFVIGISKTDIISWSYDYLDGAGNTVVTSPTMVPEPQRYTMLLSGLLMVGLLRQYKTSQK